MFDEHGEGSWIEAALISGETRDWALSLGIAVLANIGFVKIWSLWYTQIYQRRSQLERQIRRPGTGMIYCRRKDEEMVDRRAKVVLMCVEWASIYMVSG